MGGATVLEQRFVLVFTLSANHRIGGRGFSALERQAVCEYWLLANPMIGGRGFRALEGQSVCEWGFLANPMTGGRDLLEYGWGERRGRISLSVETGASARRGQRRRNSPEEAYSDLNSFFL